MNKKVCIFINGILTRPGDSKGWTDRAVTHTHVAHEVHAEKLEYFTFALTRGIKQKARAKLLADLIKSYAGWEITLVGHSNGANVICNALKLLPFKSARAIYLISPACKADFDKNGLNLSGVEDITICIAERDKALKLARWKPAKWLGYGDLGALGPINNEMNVRVIKKDFGHSGWFKGDELTTTMEDILTWQ